MGKKTPIERFLNKIDVSEVDECFHWKGWIDITGYARILYKGKEMRAHRFIYLYCNGDLPDGKDIHHTCGNKECVNPYHLIAISHKDHMNKYSTNVASINIRKTHCPRGHELKEPNLKKTKRGRECLLCHREKSRISRRKNGINPKKNIYLTLGGETLTQKEWAYKLSLSDSTIYYRIRRGLPVEEILFNGRFSPGGRKL